MREANITYAPDVSDEFPWNVGLYDTETGDQGVGGYVQSVGAVDLGEASHMAYAWIAGSDWPLEV